MKPKVLLTEPIPNNLSQELAENVELTIGKRGFYNNEQNLVDDIAEFDGLISMLSNPVSSSVIKTGKNLKIIANYAVGYNNIDVHVASKLGVKVANTPDVLTESTADGIMALLLATARNIPQADRFVRDKLFNGWDPSGFLGMNLSGKTLGVVGLGRIGQAVSKRAKAFGMKTVYLNRNRLDKELERKLGVKYVPNFNDLASTCDILCLTCPLTDETHHLVNANTFKVMKSTSILINGARGPVVNEKDLVEALSNKSISAAGLDVYEFEPRLEEGLRELENCVLLPHIASATTEARSSMGELSTGAILTILTGKQYPCNFIN